MADRDHGRRFFSPSLLSLLSMPSCGKSRFMTERLPIKTGSTDAVIYAERAQTFGDMIRSRRDSLSLSLSLSLPLSSSPIVLSPSSPSVFVFEAVSFSPLSKGECRRNRRITSSSRSLSVLLFPLALSSLLPPSFHLGSTNHNEGGIIATAVAEKAAASDKKKRSGGDGGQRD